ncbi:MAG: DNA-processing protein DprA [Candidatus Omnitrophica bacterium]|nr:DNA-processing protein DprA [Candidatus Omnitrophota bacterium]
MIQEHKKYYIALNMVSGVGPMLVKRLLERFSCVRGVFEASTAGLIGVPGVSERIAADIKNILISDEFNKEIRDINHENVQILCPEDVLYPALLNEIYDPPLVLYLKGDLSLLDKITVSVVGCRRASFNGLQIAERISGDLSRRDICVVSGLARGIDTAAHKGALKGPGGTVAVLGSGLKYVYPPENKRLFDEISRHGILMSEFPLTTAVRRGNFPRRNRIISGLSLGVVVVEAAQRSGSLITANLALSQNREVFSMPGAANSINAKGTNKLIKEGAKLVETVDDIIEELNVSAYIQEKGGLNSQAPDFRQANLKSEAKQLLQFLSSEPMHIDLLIKTSTLSAAIVYKNLLDLQLRGIIREVEGKRFMKKEGY